jgi:hypothetical protein
MSAAARRKLFEQRQPLAFGTTAETCSRFIRRMCGHQDWVILLEENTIVDGSGQRLRVARTSQAREVVKSYWPFGSRFFLFVEGYNPRIHFAVFCPQLYKHDRMGRLVPLPGPEIGQFIARALNDKADGRNPWYGLTDGVRKQPIINEALLNEYDSLLVEPTLVPQMSPPRLENHVDMQELERALADEETS